MSEPTNEQIGMVVELAEETDTLLAVEQEALHALLSAYEERGRENERLRADMMDSASESEMRKQNQGLRERAARAEARLAKVMEALKAAKSVMWMAENYAEGGGMNGPEMRDYTEATAQIEAALAAAQPEECTCVGGSWCQIHGDGKLSAQPEEEP